MKRKPSPDGPGADFIASLSAEALTSAAVNHPYLRAFRDGDFPDPELALRDFAFEYGCYSNAFTRYVSSVVDNLDHEEHRNILRANLAEEQGNAHDADLPPTLLATVAGQPHTLLYRRFQEALGIDAEYHRRRQPSTVGLTWQKRFARLCETNACVGIGAIGIGTELIVSRIYEQILTGLKGYSWLTASQRVFFDLHSQCDDKHANDLLMIAESLAQNAEAREQIAYGARTAIALRATFWDAMLEQSGPASAHTYNAMEDTLS